MLTSGLKRFLTPYELKERLYEAGEKIILRIKGPLYTGYRGSLCRIELDISRREEVTLDPVRKKIGRFLPETPSFTVIVMPKEEILTEKVRAILTRDIARDLYDLKFLLDSGTKINPNMIKEKLQYYELNFDLSSFHKSLKRKKDIWNNELKPLLKEVPPLPEVLKEIKTGFQRVYAKTLK